jgi:hypothetical protein
MNFLPSMDNQNIDRDGNGVVYIKPMLVLAYVVAGALGIFALGAFVRGDIGLGLAGIAIGIFAFFRLKSGNQPPMEFNPGTRIFTIGTGLAAIRIAFDDIAGFGISTQIETGNFTQEKVLVMLKDGQSIQIGVITDANQQKRKEKVSHMMKFLYESTGIVLNVNENTQS